MQLLKDKLMEENTSTKCYVQKTLNKKITTFLEQKKTAKA